MIGESKEASLLLFSPIYWVVNNGKSKEVSLLLFSWGHWVVENDNAPVFWLVIEVVFVMSQMLFQLIYWTVAMTFAMVIWLAYQVVVNNNNNCNLFSNFDVNYVNDSNDTYGFTIIFESLYKIMNQIQVSCNGLYYGE